MIHGTAAEAESWHRSFPYCHNNMGFYMGNER